MNYRLQYKLIRVIAFFVSFLPFSLLRWCARRAGDVFYFHMPSRRKIAMENITRAFGNTLSKKKKAKIARAAFQSLASSLLELFMMKKVASKAAEIFTIVGNENLERASAKGKGVVFVISHLGAWEYLGFQALIKGLNWSVVVRKIKNPYINKYTKRLRLVTSVMPIDKINSVRPLLRQLRRKHLVGIAIDQWAGPGGLWLDFFGEKTSTTSIPARLAKQTGCALVPAYCIRKPMGKYEIHIEPEVPFDAEDPNWEEATTEKLNRYLEEKIRQYPEQWLWAHKRWKPKPSQMREPQV